MLILKINTQNDKMNKRKEKKPEVEPPIIFFLLKKKYTVRDTGRNIKIK